MELTIIHLGIVRDEVFHVHQAGCADVTRNYGHARTTHPAAVMWDEEHASRLGVVWHTYACQIAEEFESADDLERHGAEVAAEYARDFRFFPCCADLPATTPTDKEHA